MNERPWIIVDTTIDPPVGRCERCKETLEFKMPAPLDVFIKRMRAFGMMHEDCKQSTDDFYALRM